MPAEIGSDSQFHGPHRISGVNQLVDLLRKSRLLKPQEIDTLTKRFRRESTDPENIMAFGHWLVGRQYVTCWQWEKLRDGRFKGFFIDNYKLDGGLGHDEAHNYFMAIDLKTNDRVCLRVSPQKAGASFEYEIIGRYESSED